MIPEDFFVEVADFRTDLDAIAAIRQPVFEVEQNVPRDIVWDELDAHCRHAVARDLGGNPIGAGRLTPDHGIGRLAVLRDWRGKGVGTSLMHTLIDLARQLHYPEVHLHSQVHAIPFYQALGFVAEGEIYQEAGIDHQTMRLDLQRLAPLERTDEAFSRESAEIELQSAADCRRELLELLRAARRQVYVYSRDLDPEIFHGEEIVAELRRIATSGRNCEVRVLVQDPAEALRKGGALLNLAQRLSSTVLVQQPDNEIDLQYPGAFVLNDVGGLLYRPLGSRYDGVARSHAPGHHRQLLDHFSQTWDRSRPASELRAQGL